MAETTGTALAATVSSTPTSATKKGKSTSVKAKIKKTKATHPSSQQMVDAAIGALKERGGSSLSAIKKYIAANYKVNVEKLSPFIKKYIKSAVLNGNLLQTKGKGASGSFKLPAKLGKPTKTVHVKNVTQKKAIKKAIANIKDAKAIKKAKPPAVPKNLKTLKKPAKKPKAKAIEKSSTTVKSKSSVIKQKAIKTSKKTIKKAKPKKKPKTVKKIAKK